MPRYDNWEVCDAIVSFVIKTDAKKGCGERCVMWLEMMKGTVKIKEINIKSKSFIIYRKKMKYNE